MVRLCPPMHSGWYEIRDAMGMKDFIMKQSDVQDDIIERGSETERERK